MRGIISSLLSLVLALLLAQAGLAQNVTIDLTPITYPIVLPDSGGTFDYLLTVTNQGAPITATVWCTATLPNGSSWGPTLGPATQTLAAGQTQSIYRTQTVPPRAPYGYFMLHAYIGIYPDTVWAQDQFAFQHQAVSGMEQLWVAKYNGPGNSTDEANCLALDDAGNVYVTGYSAGLYSAWDYATIKYNSLGVEQWIARYNGPGNYIDVASALAVDGAGNVYVTGRSWISLSNFDYTTIKYNTSGNQLWVARYNGPQSSSDEAYSIAVDGNGNVYVTGVSWDGRNQSDYSTIKYNASGNLLWVARYNGPGNGNDMAHSIAVDDGGDAYVTGTSVGSGTNYDYATIKYDASGQQQWISRYTGPGAATDEAYALALDSEGNVYVTGYSHGSATDYDYATIKYDSAGAEQWVARYNGPGDAVDEAYAISVDGVGNVYVTGESYGIGSGYDYATIMYNSAGTEQWVARFDGLGNSTDRASFMAVDGDGNVYVTGYSYSYGSIADYATIKYNSAGFQQWVALYNGAGDFADGAKSLAVDESQSVYVTGWSHEQTGGGTNIDYCTIKYSGGEIANWMPVEATVFGQPLPRECRLEQNFPNPFNAATALSYQLSANSYVHLRVYDTAGRLVETLVDGWRSAGEHELTFDAGDLPSGMYFARLEVEDPFGTGEYVGVQKLVLIK